MPDIDTTGPAGDTRDQAAPAIHTYLVSLAHWRLTAPFVAQMIATSEAAAITRTRLTAFHTYRDTFPYDDDAVYTILRAAPGVHMDTEL